MRQTDTLKSIVRNICGELILLFAPNSLSPLHLSSFHKSILEKENKQLLKLSKKMSDIADRFLIDNKSYINNIELFYKVYNQIDDLTIKELNILYEFCYLLKQTNSFNSENKFGMDSYYKYINAIEGSIVSQKSKKKKKTCN